MFPTQKISILAIAGALLMLSAAGARVTWAQVPVAPGNIYNNTYYNTDPFDVSYPITDPNEVNGPKKSVPTADNLIRLVNPTTHANIVETIATGSGSTSTNVSLPGLCAYIYVYDDAEEPIACCGCPITNDGELTLSVVENLTGNPETANSDLVANTHGVIQIVSGDPNTKTPITTAGFPGSLSASGVGSFCDPTGAFFGGATPIVADASIREWIAHEPVELFQDYPPLEPVVAADIHAAEVPFLPVPLTAQHLADLQTDCQFVIQEGSGDGVCSCLDYDPTPPPQQMGTPPPAITGHFE